MAELKTKENSASVTKFINSVENEERRSDAKILLKIFTELTKEKPKMWGTSIIGFGKIHYKSSAGSEGDWMATGFSPRKQNLSLYILSGFDDKAALLEKLGKHKTGRGCLYINRLADIHLPTLKKIIKSSYLHTKKTNCVC